MYAVVSSGGHQFKARVGDTLRINKVDADLGTALSFDKVLLLVKEAAPAVVGRPHVSGAVVKANVLSHGRGPKIRIIKFKRRKHHMKRLGHRQAYTEIQITGIEEKE